jgi:outer membrane protein OmpA-like peptidoglycan-associated protein
MKRIRFYLLGILLLIPAFGFCQNSDVKGSKDHPLVTRMPDFYIGQYEENEYEKVNFKTDAGTVSVEGHAFEIDYRLKEGVTPSGKTQILQNYNNALSSIGAKVLLKGSYYHVYKITKGDKETWVKVDPGNYDGKRFELTIVERTVLVQEVFADASIMKTGISNTGFIALYGIYFDSGKSIVKPESDKTLLEITKLLKDNPKLNLFIVGHTDSDGDLPLNMELSQKRAEAVVTILTSKYGINKSRIVPKGLGPLSPVASNRTPEGKAKNRRVVLVEKLH